METTSQSHGVSESTLQEAGKVVRGGGVIPFPTETFYGLGVDPFNVQAVQRLYALKGRSPQTSPILLLIRSRHELLALVSEITPAGLPSTVVDTTVSPPRLIREGCVAQTVLRAVLPSWAV